MEKVKGKYNNRDSIVFCNYLITFANELSLSLFESLIVTIEETF